MLEEIGFILRAIILIAVFTVFVLLGYAFSVDVSAQDISKTGTEAANLMMESNLTESRGVFLLEKLQELDNTYEEPVRPCETAVRYEFYLLNQTGKGKKWSFGFLNDYSIFMGGKSPEENFAKSVSVSDYRVWIKDGSALLPAEMRVVVFDIELARFTCAAERALEKKSVQAGVSCGRQSGQLQLLATGLKISVPGNCRVFQEGKSICISIVPKTGTISGQQSGTRSYMLEKICRLSSAEFLGEFTTDGDLESPFIFGYDELERTGMIFRKHNLADDDDKSIVVVKQ